MQTHTIEFLLSAQAYAQLPADEGIEIAFIGRSNAGKSSALNAITGIKNLARTSKTPGRTQAINIFSLNEQQRLVDLPGYGYAKVPQRVKAHWEKLINRYLQERRSLVGLVVIMDIRRPMQALDSELLHWAAECGLKVHILLTKADKLKRGPVLNTLAEVEKQLASLGLNGSVQVFSSTHKTGVEAARNLLENWFMGDQ